MTHLSLCRHARAEVPGLVPGIGPGHQYTQALGAAEADGRLGGPAMTVRANGSQSASSDISYTGAISICRIEGLYLR